MLEAPTEQTFFSVQTMLWTENVDCNTDCPGRKSAKYSVLDPSGPTDFNYPSILATAPPSVVQPTF